MRQDVQTDLEADRQVANTLAELIIGGSLASTAVTSSLANPLADHADPRQTVCPDGSRLGSQGSALPREDDSMTTLRATAAHTIPQRPPIQVVPGQQVQPGQHDTDWPAFVFITTDDGAGWSLSAISIPPPTPQSLSPLMTQPSLPLPLGRN